MKHSLAVTIAGIMLIMHILGCSRQHEAPGTDCLIDKGPCVKATMPGNLTAVFDIQPKPVKMMSPLSFNLSLRKGDRPMTGATVLLYLTMPGMYMGEHRIAMNHVGGGRYEGSSSIPRCPSGKRVWKAAFIVNETNDSPPGAVTAEYIFEVKE